MNNNHFFSLLLDNLRFERTFLRYITVFLLIVAGVFLISTSSSVRGQGPIPTFDVEYESDFIDSYDWEVGQTITLTIDDLSTPTEPDFTMEEISFDAPWSPGSVYAQFDFAGMFDVYAGHEITLSDGQIIKTHIVTNLAFSAADTESDTISGTASPGAPISIMVCDESICAQRNEITDSSGNFLANFAFPGDETHEQDTFDVFPGNYVAIDEPDEDNDKTSIRLHIPEPPNPTFQVQPLDDRINGWEWDEGATIDLSIDDLATTQTPDYAASQIAYVPDWDPDQTVVEFYLQGTYDLKAGDIVQMTDGTTTKAHTVTDLAVTIVDPDADTVSGTAVSGSEIDVWIHEPDSPNIRVVVDASGDWTADFSGQWDMAAGTNGSAQQNDEDGDGTWVGWNVPNPTFAVRPDGDNVEGWGWLTDTDIMITLNEQHLITTHTDEWGNFSINLGDAFDIVPGTYVKVTDGIAYKDHTVTNLTITAVDVGLDVVTGTASPGSQIQVWTGCGEYGCINRSMTADGSGNWQVDFSVPGDNPGEEETADIGAGTWVDSGEWDDDGDITNAGYNVPNPHFAVRLFDAHVEGWEWPLDAVVTMTIDDPATTQNPDYEATQTVVPTDWDPHQTHVQFDFNYVHFIEQGHVVTLSDGETTKTHTVLDLGITDVDEVADTVSGTAVPDSQVDAWICEEWGCANRHVTADSSGNWLADFANLGPQGDEQDTYDIVPGTRGDVSQSDDDGDRTEIWWNISNPRLEVSYEHNWIQISGFTPDGQVTYTIFDYENGHALFGPVTGPVDPHGNGWISQNLFHTDLVPGMFVTAVDETTGEEVSLLIQTVNIDYVGIEDDRAFGTAVPNTSIELNLSETQNDGFQLILPVDQNGYWEVDLAAAGYPIEEYRYANANLYDAEGDNIVAQNPRLHAQVSTDHIGVDNFSKNADVTMTLYDSPGGNILYGPETLHTDGDGNAWVNLWELGLDLQVGHTFTAYDHDLNFTKTLEIEPFTFEEMNVADDTVRGTSKVDEWVDLHVESLFSNWGLNALTDEYNQWFADYGSEGYDITEQMWAHGWAVDNQGNWSEDHITGLPNIEASTSDDWINGWNFSPERPVHIDIFDGQGGPLLTQFEVTADGNTQFHADYWQHEIDLQPGMFILVQDIETGKSASLLLVHLTFDGVDFAADTAWGQADAGTQVVVRANSFFEGYETAVTADASGLWFADFNLLGADLTPDWGLRAYVYDLELDANVADAPQPAQFTAGIDGDWINGHNWTGNSNVQISVHDDEGSLLLDAFTWETDPHGNFHTNLWEQNVDLQPGYYVVVYDMTSGQEKALTLSGLSIEFVDYDQDIVGGTAPPDTRLTVGFGDAHDYFEFDRFSDADGIWLADFAVHHFDLRPGMSGNARIVDDDGDATQVDIFIRQPAIWARPHEERVEAVDFNLGEMVGMEVYDAGDPNQTTIFSDIALVEPAPDFIGPETIAVFEFQEMFDLLPGHVVRVSDGLTTKEVFITPLAITAVDIEADIISGNAAPVSAVTLEIWQDCCYQEQFLADEDGNWAVNLNGMYDLDFGTSGGVFQQDEDGDRVEHHFEIESPPFLCQSGDSVSGFVYEGDGVTPIAGAEVHFDDFFTHEPLFYTNTDGNGGYSCRLPEGDFRVWAVGGGYSREYYEEAIYENATAVQVAESTPITGIDFLLDTPVMIVDFLIFNTDNPFLSDIAVRQAIAFGTDRQRILDESFPASPLLDSYLPPHHWAYAGDGLMQYNFDPDLAQLILEQAGWVDEDGDGIRERNGERLSFRYVTTIVPQGHFREVIALIFTENMAAIGIEVLVDYVPAPWDDIHQDSNIGIAQWAWVEDVNAERSHDTLSWVFHSELGFFTNYHNPTADQFLDLFDLFETRAGLLPSIQQHQIVVMADLLVLPLLQRVPDEPGPLSTFVALGVEGVYLKQGTTVVSGDVGADTAVDGPYLSNDAEVVIGTHVTFLNPASRLLGDSLRVKAEALVYDIYYNDLDGNGTVLGEQFTPVDLPLVPAFPDVPDFTPGTQALDVAKNGTLTLDAGRYGRLAAGKGAAIIFSGGVYDFTGWDIGQNANLYFEAASEVRIAGKLMVDKGSYVGPSPNAADLGAGDIVIYILGENGKNGLPDASPKAAVFGLDNMLIANVYVPNGTLHIRQGSNAVGGFLGKWVLVGNHAALTLDSGW